MIEVSHISVVGRLWVPDVLAAKDIRLDRHDVSNMGDEDRYLTREDVEDWLNSHEGDFCEIVDFSACIGQGSNTYDFPWADEESELTYSDCMYPDEKE